MDSCKDWTQLKVTVPLQQLDALVAVMSMLNNNLMIEDYSDIDLKTIQPKSCKSKPLPLKCGVSSKI